MGVIHFQGLCGRSYKRRPGQPLFAAVIALAVGAWAGIGLAHDDIDASIGQVTQDIERTPENPRLYLDRANLHREHSDWEAVEADLEQARALDPDHPHLFFSRALLARDTGDWDRAVELFHRFVEESPGDSRSVVSQDEAHTELGHALGATGRWRAAADEFVRAIESSERSSPQLYLDFVNALDASGEPGWEGEALNRLDQGIEEIGPGSVLPALAIGLELRRDNIDAALRRIEQRMQVPGYRLQSLVRKAEVLEQAGRIDAAKNAYVDARRALDELPAKVRGSFAARDLKSRVLSGMSRTNSPGAS